VLLRRAAGALLLVLLAVPAVAQRSGEGPVSAGPGPRVGGEEGSGRVGFQLGYYQHEDGGGDGNPFLDEDLTVIEPVILFDYDASDRWTVGGLFSYDYVSSASIERLSNFPDQSGASRDNYFGLDLHANYRKDRNWTLGGHAGYSIEYDYRSIGLGLGATQELDDADASLSYSLDGYFDSIDVIRFDGTEEGSDSRTSLAGTVNWYQVLTPRSHGSFGLTLAQQSGFLETPYNAVVVEDGSMPGGNPNLDNMANGVEITEELPDTRTRGALFGRVRTSLGRGKAWELGGRLYADSWGINSLTVEPRYYFMLGDFEWRLRYRLYTQTAADDFQEHVYPPFPADDEYRTQDSDLAAFDAHTLGAKWTWFAERDVAYDLSLDYTMRSDGLDQFFASVGWNWSF